VQWNILTQEKTKKFSTNQARDVIHTWEITASTPSAMSEMLEVILTPQNIGTFGTVILLDLSKPAGLLDNLVKWLEILRKRVDECVKELRLKGDPIVDVLKKKANFAIDEHPDKNTAKPIGVPVLLIGTKYDLFQDTEMMNRKVISKTLRYTAQLNCCSLVYISKEDETLISKFRGILNFFYVSKYKTNQKWWNN